MRLSLVIPAYNESAGIEQFHNDILRPHLKGRTSYEIIYVNDGSRDKTLSKLKKLAKKDSRVRVVNLSRNFGKEIAVTAGIHQASGDAIVILDADGQHPPELIKEFVKRWRSGAQVVVGVRESNTGEGLIKKWGSKTFYRIFNNLSGTTIVPGSTDFRLIDKQVQAAFMQYTERSRITRGLIDWLGFERAYIPFTSPARIAGTASYSTKKLIQLAINSFLSMSLWPLMTLVWIGIAVTALAVIAGIFIIIEQFILDDPMGINITGSAMLGVFISFLVGMVLTSQGIVAMYMSRMFEQTQARPLFVIDEKNSVNLK